MNIYESSMIVYYYTYKHYILYENNIKKFMLISCILYIYSTVYMYNMCVQN